MTGVVVGALLIAATVIVVIVVYRKSGYVLSSLIGEMHYRLFCYEKCTVRLYAIYKMELNLIKLRRQLARNQVILDATPFTCMPPPL